MRALMPALGISRVSDITRMDRLGVPVCASIRPRGCILRVHAGKGLNLQEARVGAAMEAIEYAVAERASKVAPDARISIAELLAQFDGTLHWLDLAPLLGVPVASDRVLPVVRCERLVSGGTCLVPAELVSVPCAADPGGALFGWSTNGLASGNSLEEATLHALLEVLERDAIAIDLAAQRSLRMDLDPLPAPFSVWAERWREIGIDLIVRCVPNDFGLPCFRALLHEPASADVNLAEGSGLHVDRGVALARAVCEAAQSRLTFIHGGRDDVTRFFAKYRDVDSATRLAAEERLLAWMTAAPRRIRFDDVPQPLAPHVEPQQLLGELLAHLDAANFGAVWRRRMDDAVEELQPHGLHVVKVVVARCESIRHSGFRMGSRMLSHVRARN